MKIKKEWGNIEDAIECPMCGDSYVHFKNAYNMAGQDNGLAWEGRGDSIKIPCWCENNDHEFNIIIGFHKGNSFITYEEIS